MAPSDLERRIETLDATLFGAVEAQVDDEDRRSLLALHAACRSVHGTFTYLEIGSFLGGSMQVLLRDPACTSLVSIDPRPASQHDERGVRFHYRAFLRALDETDRYRSEYVRPAHRVLRRLERAAADARGLVGRTLRQP